jgi:AraC-like DNA-binding protein
VELLARVTTRLKQGRIFNNLLKRVQAYEERFGPLDPEAAGDKDAAAALSGRHVQRVYQACEILLEDLKNPPSLRDLAARVGTNAKKLSKDFQVLYSMTAFEWLREQRIQKAAKLLRYSEMPLEAIAAEVGYSSSANFCTAFKRRMNVSPIRYRGGSS